MLVHPGPIPQRPIAPITLLTLSATLPNLPDPRAAADSESVGFCILGEEGFNNLQQPNPQEDTSVLGTATQQQAMQSKAEQVDDAQAELTQLAEDAWQKALETSASAAAETDPWAGTQELGADLKTLRVLVWVNPAAAKEAWATLKEFAAKGDVHCVSRYFVNPIWHLSKLSKHCPRHDIAVSNQRGGHCRS